MKQSHGSKASFAAAVILSVVMVAAGFAAIRSGALGVGLLLIVLAVALSGYAKTARGAHLHQQKMTGLWEWAQGLGPRKGRRS